MNKIKRAVAMTLILALLTCCVPALGQTVPASVEPIYSIETEIFEKMVDLIIGAIKEKMPEWAASAAQWGGTKLLEQLFPELGGNEAAMMQMLSEIKNQLDEMSHMLDQITNQITCEALAGIWNNFKTETFSQVPPELINALKAVDGDSSLNEAQRKAKRLGILTEGIGIYESMLTSANTEIDTYTDKVLNLVSTSYTVNLDGVTTDMDLMEVLRQLMMRTYKWENTAYETWQKNEIAVLSYASMIVLLDEMSVTARYELCKEKGYTNTEMLVSRMNTLNGNAATLEKYRKNEVRKLDDKYRHYWWQGKNDLYFYTQPNTQDVPQEYKNAGVYSIKYLHGIYQYQTGNGPRIGIINKFWAPFITYSSENASLISLDTLQGIYQDYGGQKSLWDIFFTESEGNFNKPEGTFDSWHWIIAPDAKYPLTYRDHLFKADQLYCFAASDPGATGKSATKLSPKNLILCYYHMQSTEPQKYRNSVGIGVYRPNNPGTAEIRTEYIPDPPQTGDGTPVALYLILFAAAAGSVLFILRRRRIK